MYFADTFPEESKRTPHAKTAQWKKNGRIDIFHERHDGTDPDDDPYSVAEHYYERTTMPYG